jgi:hypothetical protein
MRKKQPSLTEIALDVARDALDTIDPREQPTPPGRSLGPDDPICQPVMVERARRKQVDEIFDKRMHRMQRQVQVTMWSVLTMVTFAGLEYLGILGEGTPPVWARAVFDGLAVALGK